MDCPSCAATIERALSRRSGVLNSAVNFTTRKAALEYDPMQVNLEEILDVVKRAGYKAREFEGELEGKKGLRKEWYAFALGVALTIPIVLIMKREQQ
jgi:Cu+-exporting ATPase